MLQENTFNDAWLHIIAFNCSQSISKSNIHLQHAQIMHLDHIRPDQDICILWLYHLLQSLDRYYIDLMSVWSDSCEILNQHVLSNETKNETIPLSFLTI